MENEITGTPKELAERMGVDDLAARAILKFLVAKNIAKEAGKRAPTSGRGISAQLYTIPTTPITLLLVS